MEFSTWISHHHLLKSAAHQQRHWHQQKASKLMAKMKEGAKTVKDRRKGKVRMEMETASRTLRSPLSPNLLPRNRGKTTLQWSYHTINLRLRAKFGCVQGGTGKATVMTIEQERSAKWQTITSQTTKEQIPQLPLHVPRGDSQEEISLTTWVRA